MLDPPRHDESDFTPGAETGWHAWDQWSPELEFCEFVGMLARMLAPRIIVETGVGIGRVTRHLNLDLATTTYLGYESDEAWRATAQAALPVSGEPTPSNNALGHADLLVLDSAPDYRLQELGRWGVYGKRGAVCVVHDAGEQHPTIREACRLTGQPGMFLQNPRGGWVGIHD